VNIVTDHRWRIGTWSIRRFASASERFASFRVDGPTCCSRDRRARPTGALSKATNDSMATRAMIELYTDRLNPRALWFWGAKTLFES
jgi:hypothetical protein